jgi:bifunctional non-homologous end joining protein LigD
MPQPARVLLGGWRKSHKQGRSLRSLLLGFCKDGKLVFAGKARARLSLKFSHDGDAVEKDRALRSSLHRCPARLSPWLTLGRAPLVAEIAYGNWTADGVMRHPKHLGLREDRRAREVRLERG